jgi:parvulin-like peptidyl-prolyl isomerase
LTRLGRAAIWLAAGCAVALPLAACQPKPPKPSDSTSTSTPPTPSTQASASPAATPTPQVIEREKIVYVDRNTPATDEVVATVAGREIRFSQIKQPLLKGWGLNVLLNVVQLELAKAEAERRGLTVTDADIAAEVQSTAANMFPDADAAEYPRLLEQLLQQQRLTRGDFDMAMTVNAYLRKIATSMMTQPASEETLREAFNVLYGETVRVRHIAVSNMQEVGEAQKRLQAGVPFDAVAREMSRNPKTGPIGGELPPFSRAATDITPVFKDTAFALKEGEVSDPVQAEGFYHLIKLDRRIPPKAVKYEDVKDAIRTDLTRKATDAAVKEFRQTLGAQARETLKISDPTLAEQWKARLDAAERQAPAGAR